MARELSAGGLEMAQPGAVASRRLPRQVALESLLATLFRAGEATFAVVALFLFSQALVPLLLDQSGGIVNAYEPNPTLRNMFASIHAITLLLLVWHTRRALPAVSRHPTVVALVLLALASTLWSAAPDVTLRRGFSFLGTTAFGLLLAIRYDTRAQLKLLVAALGLAALLSLLFAVGLPAYGIASGVHQGEWRGIYTEKNTLGQMMALGTIACVLLYSRLERGRWLVVLLAGLSFGLILMSHSTTALTTTALMLLLMAASRVLRLRVKLMVAVLCGVLALGGAAIVWFTANAEGVLTYFGKDPSLTGRTPMWNVVVEMIARRPVLGYGYSAFWLGMRPPSAEALARIGWHTPNAHNGYLDVTLQLGLVGLVVFLAGVVTVFSRAVISLRARGLQDALWPMIFLSFLLLYSTTETILIVQNHILWALYAMIGASAALARPANVEGNGSASGEIGTTRTIVGSRLPSAGQPVDAVVLG